MPPKTSRVRGITSVQTVQFRRYARARVFWNVCAVFALGAFLLPFPTTASSDAPVRATVLSVLSEEETIIPGTETRSFHQILEAKTDGGELFTLENDRVRLAAGDSFFVFVNENPDEVRYAFYEPDRRGVLAFAVALFAGITILIGRTVGVRALVALIVSGGVIFYYLLPQLAEGGTPVFVAVISSALILGLAMVVTHGFSKTTLAAFLASIITISCAALLGEFFVSAAHLSGFVDDASVVLNFSTGGTLDLSGILLVAIIIGVLGIIDDLAVTQVSTVAELKRANPALSNKELYRSAMRVGREHLGAVTNTLIFAYAGASLPLLLIFAISDASPILIANGEVVASEIIRASVGGVVLALVLPVATALGILAIRTPKSAERNS